MIRAPVMQTQGHGGYLHGEFAVLACWRLQGRFRIGGDRGAKGETLVQVPACSKVRTINGSPVMAAMCSAVHPASLPRSISSPLTTRPEGRSGESVECVEIEISSHAWPSTKQQQRNARLPCGVHLLKQIRDFVRLAQIHRFTQGCGPLNALCSVLALSRCEASIKQEQTPACTTHRRWLSSFHMFKTQKNCNTGGQTKMAL